LIGKDEKAKPLGVAGREVVTSPESPQVTSCCADW
jgi:hypothetical protein